jgi:hypothetical protein
MRLGTRPSLGVILVSIGLNNETDNRTFLAEVMQLHVTQMQFLPFIEARESVRQLSKINSKQYRNCTTGKVDRVG